MPRRRPPPAVIVPAAALVLAMAIAWPQRAGAQSTPREWIVQTLITAGAAVAADWLADEPGLGAAFGIAYAAGHHYMGLRIEDWEVGKTNHGAGLIGPVVIGVALAILLDEGRDPPAPKLRRRRTDLHSHPQRDPRLEPVLVPGPAGLPVLGHPQLAPRAEPPLDVDGEAAAPPPPRRGV